MVSVSVAMALICFAASPDQPVTCSKALIGTDTVPGTYILVQRMVDDPLYGGDILQYKETSTSVFAIHRIWLGDPKEHRDKRIQSDNAKDRIITKGCINVTPKTYKELLNCCSNDTLEIRK